jgi:effector-binding domain-containing protein
MHCEPTAKSEATGTPGVIKQILNWKGEVIGEGQMTITQLEDDKTVEMKIEFFAPWKSVARSVFEISYLSVDECRVTWTMFSQLPFFMFFFKKAIEAMMGSDFERGLVMLKELAEVGRLSSSSIFQGEKTMEGFQLLGQRMKGRVSDLPIVVPKVFAEMNALIDRRQLEKPTVGITVTHDFDHSEGICVVTVGYAYPLGKPLSVPTGYKLTEYPEHKGLVVDHYGAYRHLRNPWAMASAYQRSKKKKANMKVPCYEMYLVTPNDREQEPLTQIVIPVKS